MAENFDRELKANTRPPGKVQLATQGG